MKPPTKTKIIEGKIACYLDWSGFWYTLIDQKPHFWSIKYVKWKPSASSQIRNIILKYFIENNLIQPIQPKTNNKMTAKEIQIIIKDGGTTALSNLLKTKANHYGNCQASLIEERGEVKEQFDSIRANIKEAKVQMKEIETLLKALEKHTAE